MKKPFLMLVALLLGTGTALADLNPNLKVTSFVRVEGSKVAELCGVVEGNDNTPMAVEVVVDPDRDPGFYHTTTGHQGRFCLLVRTATGKAELSLLGGLDPKQVPAILAE